MARKKKEPEKKKLTPQNVEGLHAEVLEQPITDTLTVNYMPYAMSVIVSRAIPEIDGFKPSHRKLLYDSETVDFVDNYSNTMKEPVLLPTAYPNVLVSANTGIAVGMASNICGFNLREVCNATAAWIKNPDCDLLELMPAPDFPTGGEILYNANDMAEVYRTGRGSVKLRARWRYVKEGNLIEVFEIPYTTTTEAIIDKVSELIKAGKIREISDMRDETDLSGLKLTIDLKRGVDPDKLMQKLFRATPLMDSFACNFNILIAGMPRVLGVREIIEEWTAWRTECVRRRVFFQKRKKSEKLHMLKGLRRILLDIDKAIRIIRETESDAEVIPNLMIGFGIDQVQAEYVAEIKLRNINKEYILKRTQEVDTLAAEIADLEELLASDRRIRAVITDELKAIAEKYGKERRTAIVYDHELDEPEEEPSVPDYPVTVFVSREGYFKKITAQSLRMSGEQRFKEGDSLKFSCETTNAAEILVFTDRYQVYKARCADFDDGKASVLGDYLPTKLGFDEGENVIDVCLPGDYSGSVLFVFENGKAAKVELSAYQTKSNRRKLTGAYSDKSPLKAVFLLKEDAQLALYSSEGRALIFSTAQLAAKTTRNTQGVAVLTLKRKAVLTRAARLEESGIVNPARYRTRTIPAAGALLRDEDSDEKQIELEI